MGEIQESNCIIFGGSIQYIVNYDEYLNLALSKAPKYLIIDRTPVSDEEWYGIEYVHEPIYEATYPIHVFDINDLIKMIEKGDYRLKQTWIPETNEWFSVENKKCIFQSFLFEKGNRN